MSEGFADRENDRLVTNESAAPSIDVSNYVQEQLFELLVELEVQKAVRLGYCFSVVCFMPNLPPDVADPQLGTEIAKTAIRQLRATDVATSFARGSGAPVGLLLIDADLGDLPPIFNRLKPELETSVTADAGQRLTWSGGSSCYPQTATGTRDLLQQAFELMARAEKEGADRFYLPSQGEPRRPTPGSLSAGSFTSTPKVSPSRLTSIPSSTPARRPAKPKSES